LPYLYSIERTETVVKPTGLVLIGLFLLLCGAWILWRPLAIALGFLYFSFAVALLVGKLIRQNPIEGKR
jgi:hypothetical protein